MRAKDGAEELKEFYNIDKDDEKAARKEKQQEQEQPQKSAMDYARGEAIMEDSSSDSDSDDDSGEDVGDSSADDDDEVELQPENYDRQLIGSDEEEEESNEDENEDDEDGSPQALNDDEIKDEMRRLDAQAEAYNENVDEEDTIDFTSRLAVTNLDWDHLSAQDIYVALDSVLQGTEHKKGLKNISVYMSQFGKKRIQQEEQSGPALIGGKKSKKGKERELDPDSALREYQLGRLRYYYAIVTLSSSKAAHKLFSEAQSTEIERTANILQFEVVPDGVEFDEDDIRDQASTSSESYKGVDFQTPALRHSKVKLTWDEDDDKRASLTRKRMNKEDIEQNDFKAYLASESEDESDNDEDDQKRRAALLRAALSGDQGDARELRGGKKDREGEMEVTFAPGLSEKNAKKGKDSDDDENMTTLERYKKKEKAKKDAKKDNRKIKQQDNDSELELEHLDKPQDEAGFDDDFFQSGSEDEAVFENRAAENNHVAIDKPSKKNKKSKKEDAKDNGRVESNADELKLLTNEKEEANHFDMDDIFKNEKKQGRKRKHAKKSKDEDDAEDNFEINVNDGRFKGVLEDHHYAIDPTLPK